MIGLCLLCGDNPATQAPVTLAGRRIMGLCSICDWRLRRAAEFTPPKLERLRDEYHLRLAVISTLIQPSKALAPVVSRMREIARAKRDAARGA